MGIRMEKNGKPIFKSCDKCGEQIGGALYLADRLIKVEHDCAEARMLLKALVKELLSGWKTGEPRESIYDACEYLGHPKKEGIPKCYCGLKKRNK
jgi:hypothetical protein